MFRWELINDHTEEREILSTDPHGWEDISLEHNRSERYDGMFLDFSRDLSFHCKGGGKEMLDDIFNEYGSEGQATLIIYFSCDGRFKKLAETFIHFPTYREEYKGKTLHTTVEVRKKGITQTVMSRDDTDVDLLSETSIGGVALNPYDYGGYTLNSHSKTIRLISKYNGHADTSLTHCRPLNFNSIQAFVNAPGLTIVSADLEKTNDNTEIWQGNTYDGISPLIDTQNQPYSYPITINISWDFSGSWRMTFVDPDELTDPCVGTPESVNVDMLNDFELRLVKTAVNPSNFSDFDSAVTNGWLIASIPEQSYITDSITESFSGQGGITLTLNSPAEKIYLVWVMSAQINVTGNVGASIWFEYDTAEIEFISDTNSPPTFINVVAIHEAWSRICEGITDQTLAFKSAFFGRKNSQGLSYSKNGYGSYTAITDGLRIRGFMKVDSAILNDGQTKKGIITTLKDMYDSCNAVWGVGLGVETHEDTEVVRVEEKDYFYSDTEAYRIANIPNIEMHFAEEMAYSEVQLGYEKWKIENKGGLDEPNTIARWVFPKIKNIKNVKELTSPYVAGMYAIEWTRRENLIFNTTGDSDYDDEIFFIALKRSRPDQTPTELHLAEKNENITITQDTLLAPETAYNLRFNLFSNFDRVMNQFTTNLTKDLPQQINYSYLEGNGQMEFDYQDTLVWPHAGDLNGLKSQNVQNTETPNGRHRRQYPLFIPEVYTFSFPVPFSDYITLIENPYGYISFSSTDKNFKQGYIKKLSYNIAKQMAEFTLIRKFQW